MEPHTGFLNFIVNYILCTYLPYIPTHKRKNYDRVKFAKQLVLCALSRLMCSLTPIRYVYENKILFNSKKMKLQNLQENEWTQCILLRETFQPQDKKHVHPHIWILICNIYKYRCKQIYIWVQDNKKRREQERINVG